MNNRYKQSRKAFYSDFAKSFLIPIILFTSSCSSSPEKRESVVSHVGELRQIMHKGKYQARLAVDTLDRTNLYAVGALENLSGEITVVNGKVFASKVLDDSVKSVEDRNLKATLMVTSRIARWDTIRVKSIIDLEETIASLSIKKKFTGPFPFMVLGTPNSVTYHVINFDTKNGDNHKAGSKYESVAGEEVILVGFYATDAKGVYTHHDSNIHVHVVTKGVQKTGHLEAVVFGENSFQLLIPKS